VERSQALTLQYDKVVFILEPSEQAKAAIGKGVTVVDYPDGRLSVELAYRTFDKVFQVDASALPPPSSPTSSVAVKQSGAAGAISATLVSPRPGELL
jgi:hypothetical protein